jgi:hypothetical protein
MKSFNNKMNTIKIILILFTIFIVTQAVFPQDKKERADDTSKVTLTVILRPNQDLSTQEIQQQMLDNAFWKTFPPDFAEIFSWYSVMGVGQIITLRIPISKLSEFNETVQNAAWGAYTVEFYITYDYMPFWKDMKGKYR